MKPTFQATRELHYIDRSKLARITGLHVDELWVLEKTGRGTEETWKQVIDALNQLAKTDYVVMWTFFEPGRDIAKSSTNMCPMTP